ncbi:MAG: hypothetical protein ACYTGF_08785, partial [Planctomycetota bacterium]
MTQTKAVPVVRPPNDPGEPDQVVDAVPAALRQRERIPTVVFEEPDAASATLAREIAQLIRHRAKAGRQCVLGLATGSTPMTVYGELVRLHRREGLSFANVVTF